MLHAAKSLGKIAAIYEERDHVADDELDEAICASAVGGRRAAIRAAAADLVTAALRFANLEHFDLAEALIDRVKEKNGVSYPEVGQEA